MRLQGLRLWNSAFFFSTLRHMLTRLVRRGAGNGREGRGEGGKESKGQRVLGDTGYACEAQREPAKFYDGALGALA